MNSKMQKNIPKEFILQLKRIDLLSYLKRYESIIHAGLSIYRQRWIWKEHHLHGEIVAYGVLVLLTMDGQRSERNELMKLYRAIGLPTRLQDLDMTRDMLPPVIARALEVPDAKIAPFTVTAEGLYEAIEALEEAN